MDVEAGCEGAGAGAGEEDGADCGGVGEAAEDEGEVLPHYFFEGIEFLRTIDFDMGDVFGWEGDVEEVVVILLFCHGYCCLSCEIESVELFS